METTISQWLNTQKSGAFLVKYPHENFISAFSLGPINKMQPIFSWVTFSGSKQEFGITSSKTFGLERSSPVVPRLTPITDHAAAKAQHLEMVSKAISHIQEGELEKVVLARRFDYHFNKISPTFTFLRLCNKYPNATCFWFVHKNEWQWMGATPELLASWNQSNIETTALAGTKGVDENRDWKEKEIKEQQVVTTDIIQKLKRFGAVVQPVKAPETITSGQVMHLQTRIYANLPDLDRAATIPETLHPTPAVCGIPSEKAKAYILSLERFERDAYTGYFGIQNARGTAGRYFVNLRSFRFNDSQLQLYAGGGINHMSNPEAEWQETERKLETIRAVL
jgi:isochorismate synthase